MGTLDLQFVPERVHKYDSANSPEQNARLMAPTIVGAQIAGTYMRSGVNTNTGDDTFNDSAYDGLWNPATLAQAWDLAPNMVSGVTAPIRGTLAEAQWAAGIIQIQSQLPGRP